MLLPIRRAILSVYRKEGIVELARSLTSRGVEIISTGGTERALRAEGIPVLPVHQVTGFPEILDGRVKTLNPHLLGGVLARKDDPAHRHTLDAHGIPSIDLVVVNLYPFEEAVADPTCSEAHALENIDIGGPTMLRAAAKNHGSVAVVVDPAEYPLLLAEMDSHQGSLTLATRRRLAGRAFAVTASYDAAIHRWFHREEPFPEVVVQPLLKVADLRYGENPHQRAALYRDPFTKGSGLSDAHLLSGKEMSFNNYADTEAALALLGEFREAGAVIIKHANPCGAATSGGSLLSAYEEALAGDPVSAFGGILAFNRPVEEALAERIAERFYEVVLAPSFTASAQERLSRKKNLRLLSLPHLGEPGNFGRDWKRLRGGMLLTDWDEGGEEEWRVVTSRAPTDEEARGLRFAQTVCKHVKSNAIVLARETRLLGAGAGQMSRVDSVELAVRKAGPRARGAVLASDAFFPFPDGLLAAADAGVTAAIHPGGSVKDDEVIDAANARGMAIVLTGVRHFKH